jgi:hypothetical protein
MPVNFGCLCFRATIVAHQAVKFGTTFLEMLVLALPWAEGVPVPCNRKNKIISPKKKDFRELPVVEPRSPTRLLCCAVCVKGFLFDKKC